MVKECPQCGEAQDPFGDHEVCCRKSDFWARHQTVADALARVCSSSGLRAEREVGVEGRERPADLLVRGLALSRMLLTLWSPTLFLNPGTRILTRWPTRHTRNMPTTISSVRPLD